MEQSKKRRMIGWIALVIGLMLGLMLFFEIKDGELLGSRSNGMTVSSNPITYYLSISLQSIVLLILLLSGISMIRSKE